MIRAGSASSVKKKKHKNKSSIIRLWRQTISSEKHRQTLRGENRERVIIFFLTHYNPEATTPIETVTLIHRHFIALRNPVGRFLSCRTISKCHEKVPVILTALKNQLNSLLVAYNKLPSPDAFIYFLGFWRVRDQKEPAVLCKTFVCYKMSCFYTCRRLCSLLTIVTRLY